MRGSLPIDLAINEWSQLIAWSHSESPGSLKWRNSRILLRLAEGQYINRVAVDLGLCRQTISEVRRIFLIFGLEGIMRCAPRLGRNPIISGARAKTVLQIAMSEEPLNGRKWTGLQLAMRCELPHPTISRFLKRNGISLKDPRTIRDAIDNSNGHIIGIAGLFLSTSICIMAISCKPKKNPFVSTPISITTGVKTGNVLTFFTRELGRLLEHLDETIGELSRMKPKKTDSTDFLLFMDILNDRNRFQREIMLIPDDLDLIAVSRLARWLVSHPRFHFATSLNDERWISTLRTQLNSVSDANKHIIALQLEHLNMELSEWRGGPLRNLGVFAWVNTMR